MPLELGGDLHRLKVNGSLCREKLVLGIENNLDRITFALFKIFCFPLFLAAIHIAINLHPCYYIQAFRSQETLRRVEY